jgi:Transglutaminase-like superfamily
LQPAGWRALVELSSRSSASVARMGRHSVMTVATNRAFLMQKFWRLPWSDRLLLLETLLCLAFAAVAVAALPFRHIARWASLPTREPVLSEAARTATIERVRWAVMACARRVPWRALCFEQGLAAQFMLRRRGVPATLHYGAAHDEERGLAAHVWVKDGDVDVTGGEVAARFALLATFPGGMVEKGNPAGKLRSSHPQ